MKNYNKNFLQSFIQEYYPDENIESFSEEELAVISKTNSFHGFVLRKAWQEFISSILEEFEKCL